MVLLGNGRTAHHSTIHTIRDSRDDTHDSISDCPLHFTYCRGYSAMVLLVFYVIGFDFPRLCTVTNSPDVYTLLYRGPSPWRSWFKNLRSLNRLPFDIPSMVHGVRTNPQV